MGIKLQILQVLLGSSTDPHEPVRGSQAQRFVNSPLMAEALAIRFSLRVAASLEIQHLRVCSDCQTLIRAINNRAMVSEIFGVVADINHLSSLFISISFAFIPRSQNSEADALAKHALLSFSLVMGPVVG